VHSREFVTETANLVQPARLCDVAVAILVWMARTSFVTKGITNKLFELVFFETSQFSCSMTATISAADRPSK